MPVRSRSRASMAAMRSRPPAAMSRSSSSSGETPALTKPPSLVTAGASARSTRASSAAISARQVVAQRQQALALRQRAAQLAGFGVLERRPQQRAGARASGPSTARSRGVATPRRARADQPLEVGDLGEHPAGGVARRVRGHQPLDGVVAAADGRDVDRRKQQPAAQQARRPSRSGSRRAPRSATRRAGDRAAISVSSRWRRACSSMTSVSVRP